MKASPTTCGTVVPEALACMGVAGKQSVGCFTQCLVCQMW